MQDVSFGFNINLEKREKYMRVSFQAVYCTCNVRARANRVALQTAIKVNALTGLGCSVACVGCQNSECHRQSDA